MWFSVNTGIDSQAISGAVMHTKGAKIYTNFEKS